MHFVPTADTDIGISKQTNQDSVLIKHGVVNNRDEILLALVCDGMGGLARGELASATVIREFSEWFDKRLPDLVPDIDMAFIGSEWSRMLVSLNERIKQYGTENRLELGTTVTGVLFYKNEYVFVHVGDTRLYYIDNALQQLTEDQTFVAREIKLGHMTEEQARTDRRRNVLLQCVGASPVVEPYVGIGRTEKGVYMLCTDGFRNVLTQGEIRETFAPVNMMNKMAMHGAARYLIETVKARRERDNISVILVKVE